MKKLLFLISIVFIISCCKRVEDPNQLTHIGDVVTIEVLDIRGVITRRIYRNGKWQGKCEYKLTDGSIDYVYYPEEMYTIIKPTPNHVRKFDKTTKENRYKNSDPIFD